MFVDTGVWYALTDAADFGHADAQSLIFQSPLPLVTSWPVVWETITLIARRHGGLAASQVGRELIAEKWARLLDLTPVDHGLALDIMSRHGELKLSAVDATGCALVRRLNIAQVASFDKHFRLVLPERIVLGRGSQI